MTRGFWGDRVAAWRTGSREGQLFVLALLLAGVSASLLVSLRSYELMPLTASGRALLV